MPRPTQRPVLALCAPNAIPHMDDFLRMIEESGLRVVEKRRVHPKNDQIRRFFGKDDPHLEMWMEFMLGKECRVLVLLATNAGSKLSEVNEEILRPKNSGGETRPPFPLRQILLNGSMWFDLPIHFHTTRKRERTDFRIFGLEKWLDSALWK